LRENVTHKVPVVTAQFLWLLHIILCNLSWFCKSVQR